jgi:AcrR family transcriptional regulator
VYGQIVRRHGWSGNPPATDDAAVHRILDATRACIDREGAVAGIADVARELGVTRQTVYRYFSTTEDLLTATAMDASGGFFARLEAHLGTIKRPAAEAVVEGIAYTLEQLPKEPYLGRLTAPGRVSVFSRDFTSETALTLGRAVIERFPVDWAAEGFESSELDELVEQMLRMTQSLLVDPGTPPRTGSELRRYLTHWLAPSIAVHHAASE